MGRGGAPLAARREWDMALGHCLRRRVMIGARQHVSACSARCPTNSPPSTPCGRVGVTAPFIHDLTVSSSSSMNVFVDCAGFNLNLDHHRRGAALRCASSALLSEFSATSHVVRCA